MADLMTPEDRASLLKSVPKEIKGKPNPQAVKIAQSYQTAKSLGLLGDVEGH